MKAPAPAGVPASAQPDRRGCCPAATALPAHAGHRPGARACLSRWNDHPQTPLEPTSQNGKTGDLGCAPLGFTGGRELGVEDGDDRAGTNQVQIARTFGNCRNLDHETILNGGGFIDDSGYQFAPKGDFTIESAVLGAIKRAKRYIYIEDQYLGNLKLATAVADKIEDRKAAMAADVDADGHRSATRSRFSSTWSSRTSP